MARTTMMAPLSVLPTAQSDQNIEEAILAVNTTLVLPMPSSSVASILSAARARVSSISADVHQ